MKTWVHALKREVVIDGKTYQVAVDECPIGSPFSVKVNDKTREVVLEREPDSTKGFSVKVDGKSYQVELSDIDRNAPFSTKVNKIPFKVELKSTTSLPRVAVAGPSLAPMQFQKPVNRVHGEGVVAAPMAGRIISIKVKKGDSVKVGNVLCVLEAMKMENEIASPRNGVVEDIKVQEGKAVNEGDVLILLK